MRTLRLIGLDLSLTAAGVATTHNQHGQWAPRLRTIRSDNRGHQRLQDLRVAIAETYRSSPHLAIIEAGYVGQNNNTLPIAELHGLIKHDLWLHDIDYVLVAPATVKLYATGHGGAEKDAVVHAIRGRYADILGGPSAIRTNDEADAFALVALAYHHYGQPLAPVSPKQASALASVKWPTLAQTPGNTAGLMEGTTSR